MEIVSSNKMTEGLFGMVILFIFEILPLLEKYNIDVSSLKWHISTINYGNIFPNILKYNFKNNEKLNSIESKYTFYYGNDINKIDITTKFKNLFLKNNKITIPKGTNFNNIFGDPSPNKNKTIMIYFNNILVNLINEYNTYQDIVNDKLNIVLLEHLRYLNPKYVLGDNFSKLNHLFFKYFTIPNELNEIVDKLDLQKFVGIHFRGTDKTNDLDMNTPCSKTDFLIIIDEYIKIKGIKNIFIASDEHYIIDKLKNKYPNIIFKYSRDFTDNIFWRNNPDKEKNAKFAMIDMLCLSKCKEVIKVSSALSAFSKIINPNLKIFRVNALKMFADIPYFPDAYIPLLEKNPSYSKECNSILEKIQLNDWSIKYGKNFNNFYYKIR